MAQAPPLILIFHGKNRRLSGGRRSVGTPLTLKRQEHAVNPARRIDSRSDNRVRHRLSSRYPKEQQDKHHEEVGQDR